MKHLSCFFLGLLFWTACTAPSASEPPSSEAPSAAEARAAEPHPLGQQLLLVRTSGWDEASGTLERYVYTSGSWQAVGAPIPIVVGKNGMGWGKGMPEMAQLPDLPGPLKREGDLKSPAGLFRLAEAFGYAPADSARWVKAPYLSVSSMTQCIEDVNSAYYNQIVPDTLDGKDWNSTDHMLRQDDLYEWGMVVAHNYEQPQPGAGSCIFLHVGNPEGSGTAGCTAMAKPLMRELLAWIQPELQPFLVQAPRETYEQFKSTYQLP